MSNKLKKREELIKVLTSPSTSSSLSSSSLATVAQSSVGAVSSFKSPTLAKSPAFIIRDEVVKNPCSASSIQIKQNTSTPSPKTQLLNDDLLVEEEPLIPKAIAKPYKLVRKNAMTPQSQLQKSDLSKPQSKRNISTYSFQELQEQKRNKSTLEDNMTNFDDDLFDNEGD